MAFFPQPNIWILDYEADEMSITVPLATFPRLTAAEADGATGDIRKVLLAIVERIYQEWRWRDPTDRPARMTVARMTAVDDATDTITRIYTLAFATQAGAGGIEVAAEPA